MTTFCYRGQYRVQSRQTATPSLVAGEFLAPRPGLLDDAAVNAGLSAHPAWRGTAAVALRPARVDRREGQFESRPDILYKRAFFDAAPGSEPMDADVVDVRKAARLWGARRPHVSALFGERAAEELLALVGDLEPVIANEYFVHEAGHFLGYDVLAKYGDGYFRVQGRPAWPLVHVEELRADLHAFGFATRLLAPVDAARVFVYNLLLRFGVHLEGVRHGAAPYGLVPYLLFHLLTTAGFLEVDASPPGASLRLASTRVEDLIAAMRACDEHASRALTTMEEACTDPVDVSLNAAAYVRRRVGDERTAREFGIVFRG